MLDTTRNWILSIKVTGRSKLPEKPNRSIGLASKTEKQWDGNW